jgi:Lrp/AsnC family leucine-responsive transcriptional regulator
MDDIDLQIMRRLSADGRLSFSNLADEIGLSPPAAAERVRRLEEAGTIRGYAARLDPAAAGCALLAFVAVSLERSSHRARFLAWARGAAEVQECHHVAGDDDYLLKVRCASTAALDHLLSDELKSIPGVARTRTTIALSTEKETGALPLPEAPRRGRKEAGRAVR